MDTEVGPGVEIWEVTDAPAGEYQVLYNFYRPDSDDQTVDVADVRGGVYFRDGHIAFRERRLDEVRQPELVAVVTVEDDGSVDVSERLALLCSHKRG